MFGFSKKERYERSVEVCLHALFADIGHKSKEDMVTPKLKKLYEDHWSGAIKEGVELKNSPELTAFILAMILYQDIIVHETPDEVLDTIRECILQRNYDDNVRPSMMFKISFTTMMASGWAHKEMTEDQFALGLRDIHRAIFDGDDEHIEETLSYFIEEANQIQKQAIANM